MHYLLQRGATVLTLLLCHQSITQAGTITGTVTTETFKFSPNSTAAEIIDSGAVSMTYGDTTIYVGTHQQSPLNQNAIIASVTGNTVDWIKADYENLPPDSDGRGVVWDGTNLYVVLTTDGGAQLADGGFERFTQTGWLSSYGSGGGALASLIFKLDPSQGDVEAGTFVYGELFSGETNTIRPTGLSLVNDHVVFEGDAFYSPLRADATMMNCAGSSPFDYRAVFDDRLSTAISSEAIGCDGRTEFTALSEIIDDPAEDVPEPGVALGLAAIAVSIRQLSSRRGS